MSELTMPAADREAFLAEPHIGVLTITRGATQPPLGSPVWYEYEQGGDVVINVGRGSEKARLAQAAGAASLTVQTEALPYRFVTVGGALSVGPADDATRRRIASRYLPAELVDGYLATGSAADMLTLRLTPATWHSNDYSRLM
jgi:nitroimidazol reductase NimA-like FMN-containing flavoprotein (pyridoxamine 5'-phosphate oxidase superfamily)